MTDYKIMHIKHVAEQLAHVNSINVTNNRDDITMVSVKRNQ